MTKLLSKGRYEAYIAETADDLKDTQSLRADAFRNGAPDADDYDASCTHVLVRAVACGTLVCCFRMMPLQSGAEINRSYSAQYYGLNGLSQYPGSMVEMGRFCIHPDWQDPDILRVAWGAMTLYVDNTGVEMLFGCSSFIGVDAEAFADAFALLNARHIAPKR